MKNDVLKSRNPLTLVARFRNSSGPFGGGKKLGWKRSRQTEKRIVKTEVEEWTKEKIGD